MTQNCAQFDITVADPARSLYFSNLMLLEKRECAIYLVIKRQCQHELS